MIIAGNHDTLLDAARYKETAGPARQLLDSRLPPNATYLECAGATVAGGRSASLLIACSPPAPCRPTHLLMPWVFSTVTNAGRCGRLKVWGSPNTASRRESMGKKYYSDAFETYNADRKVCAPHAPARYLSLSVLCPYLIYHVQSPAALQIVQRICNNHRRAAPVAVGLDPRGAGPAADARPRRGRAFELWGSAAQGGLEATAFAALQYDCLRKPIVHAVRKLPFAASSSRCLTITGRAGAAGGNGRAAVVSLLRARPRLFRSGRHRGGRSDHHL